MERLQGPQRIPQTRKGTCNDPSNHERLCDKEEVSKEKSEQKR